MTCKDCLHYAACKTMFESMGFIVSEDVVDTNAKCPEYKPRSPWISVDERMPKAYEPVILYRRKPDGTFATEQGMWDELRGEWKVYGARSKNVTHWMPMPEPPEEE